ncbi:MAG: response regulator [candidate division Zixibacteria bacterium]|nr:response regulator [candidate division Zixibacteria bacterium]MDH3936532.1 response regulator [candidate division Zixibacteria bacterium]MDH4035024.1 response regulator [candidate division Zixibacteria bacterium]
MNTPVLDKLTEMAKNRGRPYKVLIVDDEQWVREVFRDFCNLTDAFKVELAPDGAEAVRMAGDSEYDLITLDLIMPEMSGLEVLTAIKEVAPKVPIMVITGNATEKLVHQAGVLGACRVMYKPVMLESFISEMTSTLDR